MKHEIRSIAAVMLSLSLVLAGCAASNTETPGSGAAAPSASGSASAASAPDYADARVSYLGPEGTYTQEACELFFGGKGVYLPQEDVPASVAMVAAGECDYAVIPQENTIGGPVAEYLDEVATGESFAVVGEVELPINQNLLTAPGAKLEDVKTVYSHKQGIAQGTDWLKENLPQAEVVEVASTAEGAKQAAADETGTSAAIGSAAAARVYGLEVAAGAIQRNDANKTRFYVLAKGEPASAASDRMAFTASGDASDLAELLESAEGAGLEIIAVHDRPEKTELGRYTYLVECAGAGRDAFETLQKDRSEFTLRYLGSFPLVTP